MVQGEQGKKFVNEGGGGKHVPSIYRRVGRDGLRAGKRGAKKTRGRC